MTDLTSLNINGVPTMGIGGGLYRPLSRWWFIDTTLGSDGNTGAADSPFRTMTQALTKVGDNDVVSFIGNLREQVVAPLGITGVAIVGAMGGRDRHDNGARWYAPAAPVAGKALIEIREQGWEFHNFLMVPDNTGGAAIKAHRNEDATYPDSSHFIVNNMKFIGGGGTPIGIEDVGGNHHYLIQNSEFNDLAKAITCSSTAIAVPLRNTIRYNAFAGNTMDVATSLSYGIIHANQFLTAGSGATNKVVSTTFNAVQGGNNHVTWNFFSNTEAQIAPGNGYTGAASDMWMNYVNDQAALAFGQPA